MVRAIVGANWGDEERKNYGYAGEKNPTSSSAFRGRHNAGHTIINNYGKFASTFCRPVYSTAIRRA